MEFNVIKHEISEWLKNLKKIFKTIFERELLLSYERVDHEITLKIKKIKSLSLILIRLEEQQIVKKYLNEIIKKKWIRINKSLIITSLFLVLKPESKEKRLIIDYKKLNKKIVTDSTSLSLIGDIMNQIKEQKYFIKIDLKNFFNQIRIKEKDEWKTVFRMRYKTFEYLIMLFKLINVLITF